MEILNYIFLPITYPLSKIALSSKITNTEKEIQAMLSVAHSEGVLEPNEATLAQKALELDSKKVKMVMTPKKAIISLGSNSTVAKAKKLFAKSGFSRILVHNKNKYIGYVILKDIIFANKNELINNFVVPTIKFSQLTIISNALEQMRMKDCHIALVTTKINNQEIVGIITIEDIIEELVGEIYDEHDPDIKIKEIAHHKYVVNGSVPILDLAKKINFNFENAKNMTIKKWIETHINKKIKKDLVYRYKKKIVFKILKNNHNRDALIQISKKD